MANKNKLIPNRRKKSFKKLQEKNKNTLIFARNPPFRAIECIPKILFRFFLK